eukprot:scaffold21258_cov58-Cyclotella_meneghiniana.AAC.4
MIICFAAGDAGRCVPRDFSGRDGTGFGPGLASRPVTLHPGMNGIPIPTRIPVPLSRPGLSRPGGCHPGI